MVSLAIDLCGIKLNTPTILASGVLGLSASTLRRAALSGAGAVVTKSIGVKPSVGYPNPVIVETPSGLLNAMGLSNPGHKEYAKEVEKLAGSGVKVIASVFGGSPEEFAEVATTLVEAGACMVELNISCPHAERLGSTIGQDPETSAEVTREVKKAVKVPVIPKLTPNVSDICEIGRSVEKAGADAVSAINTLGPGMVIDTQTRRPILGHRVGGLSGPAIHPIAVRCVYQLYETVKIPIIGVGGVTTGETAIELLLAGARAVQIGTGVLYHGLEIFEKVNMEIWRYMEKHGFERVEQLVGKAH
ncbi:MAG: dihydroorotate dehydrogenase [Methanobacteriota archaeon]|nr:MAG: dihydroorotate dehydrogenase [Euryarchaeota archaeon]